VDYGEVFVREGWDAGVVVGEVCFGWWGRR
jgi:hypothetical protein